LAINAVVLLPPPSMPMRMSFSKISPFHQQIEQMKQIF